MNVFLLGFMGSGKSSLGKRLANKLNYKFIDLDAELEKLEGMSVNDIFSSKGEEFFREIEMEWLKELNLDNHVISLGGGTPCFNNNIDLINQIGISIYLKVSTHSLANRLYTSKKIRPLIKDIGDDKEKLQLFVQEKLTEREKFYTKSNIQFDGENVSSEKLDSLVQMIKMAN